MDSVSIVADELRDYVERIERLELDKIELQAHIRDVYADAERKGFDVKIMKQIIRLRKIDNDDREEQEMLLAVYKRALGMIMCEDI